MVLWNRGNVTATIIGKFVAMQLESPAHVRDVWGGKELGVGANSVTATVPRHDVAMFVLTPVTPLGLARPAGADALWAKRWRGHAIRVPASRVARGAHRSEGSTGAHAGSR